MERFLFIERKGDASKNFIMAKLRKIQAKETLKLFAPGNY